MKSNLRAGEFAVKAQPDKPVWTDRKRYTIWALPISFTVYTLTPTRIVIQRGLLNIKEEEIMLFRVRDISYSQNLFERIAGTGTVTITSTDATTPVVRLEHVKAAQDVKALLLQLVEDNRRKNRVRTAEVMETPDSDDSEMAEDHFEENIL